jgi:toxin ParE1/3/4
VASISWTAQALNALESIHDYLRREAPYYADEVVQQIIEAVDRLEAHPLSGRKVPEADQDAIREVICKHYRIIHWVISNEHIDILSVLHDSQDLSHSDNQPWGAH